MPVNWAVLHGEHETGATLHAMAAKPDAGDIVDSEAVPILPDDTALEVFRKVTVAAELALRSLPAGADRRHRAATGRRIWRTAATSAAAPRATAPSTGGAARCAAHNLIRAVAPPYPGAYSEAEGMPLRILRSLPAPRRAVRAAAAAAALARRRRLRAVPRRRAEAAGIRTGWRHRAAPQAFHRRFGERALPLKPVME